MNTCVEKPVPEFDPNDLIASLEWQDFEDRGSRATAFLIVSYVITFWRGRGEYELSVSAPGYSTSIDAPRLHPTLEAAKAAAQADYAARILSALKIDLGSIMAQAGNIEAKALQEAAKRADRYGKPVQQPDEFQRGYRAAARDIRNDLQDLAYERKTSTVQLDAPSAGPGRSRERHDDEA